MKLMIGNILQPRTTKLRYERNFKVDHRQSPNHRHVFSNDFLVSSSEEVLVHDLFLLLLNACSCMLSTYICSHPLCFHFCFACSLLLFFEAPTGRHEDPLFKFALSEPSIPHLSLGSFDSIPPPRVYSFCFSFMKCGLSLHNN
jgi:hypothetical protein